VPYLLKVKHAQKSKNLQWALAFVFLKEGHCNTAEERLSLLHAHPADTGPLPEPVVLSRKKIDVCK